MKRTRGNYHEEIALYRCRPQRQADLQDGRHDAERRRRALRDPVEDIFELVYGLQGVPGVHEAHDAGAPRIISQIKIGPQEA